MEELKRIIAKNIADLRKKNRMTQVELAERLNYTDKAVSKWERGESVPDVAILKSIADLFCVTVDYLLTADHKKSAPTIAHVENKSHSRGVITGLCILLIWMAATVIFVTLGLIVEVKKTLWLVFLWAVPVSMVIWLVMNTIWFYKRRNYLIISCLMWTVLISLHLTLLAAGINIWLIYLLGVPGQAIILLWSNVKARQKDKP